MISYCELFLYWAKLALYFANMGFQIHIMLNLGHEWYPSYRCAYINNILPLSIIPLKYVFFNFHSIPKTICTHRDQKNVILGEIEKLSLSWLNLFMIWYFPKNDFFAKNNSPIYCVIFITYWYIKLCILQQKPLKLQNIFDEFWLKLNNHKSQQNKYFPKQILVFHCIWFVWTPRERKHLTYFKKELFYKTSCK